MENSINNSKNDCKQHSNNKRNNGSNNKKDSSTNINYVSCMDSKNRTMTVTTESVSYKKQHKYSSNKRKGITST